METTKTSSARPYLIAEIGVNHEGNLDLALEMVTQVAAAGWQAAKFQTYTASTLASPSSSPAYWDTDFEPETSQHSLFSKFTSFGMSEYEEIIGHCDAVGVDFLTTAFDSEAMETFGPRMKLIKIASADITNVPLLRQAAGFGKPMIISCGAATFEEIEFSIETATQAGALDIRLLHCVLNYPTHYENAHLKGIQQLKAKFPEHQVGYSDHTLFETWAPVSSPAIAFLLGATIIEKHFTYDRSLIGNDHYHSADYDGLLRITREIDHVIKLLGSGIEAALQTQDSARVNARRRVCAAREMLSGDLIQEGDLIPLRANVGIEISEWDSLIGKRLTRDVSKLEPFVDSYLT